MNSKLKMFLNGFRQVDGNLSLEFHRRDKTTAPDNKIFSYKFKIIDTDTGQEAGNINLKAGYSKNIVNYRGNIGFTIYENFRGNHFASKACRLLIPLFKILDMPKIWVTCNVNNHASQKSIAAFGATYIDTRTIPKESPLISYYAEEARTKLRFLWKQ